MNLVILVDEHKTFVGIAEGNNFIKTERFPFEAGKRTDLFLLVSKLIKPKEISGIIVYAGPGPFTGVRVAVSIANALSFSLNIPIVGIKEINDPQKLLEEGLTKLLEKSKIPVIPFYKKAPNITKPKNSI